MSLVPSRPESCAAAARPSIEPEAGSVPPLVLLLCVVAGVIAYLLLARAPAPPPPGPTDEEAAKHRRAREDVAAIGKAVELFRADFGRLPETLDELKNPPQNEGAWDFEYLTIDPVDPFSGEPYPFESGPDGVRVGSYGADLVEGGIDAGSDVFVTVPAPE